MRKYLIGVLLTATSLNAIEIYDNRLRKEEPQEIIPYFIGSLLGTPSEVIPFGQFDIEPYLFLNASNQVYNSNWKTADAPFFWTTTVQVPLLIGFAPRLDIAILPSTHFKKTQGQKAWSCGDLLIGLDFQIYYQTDTFPDIKISISETFPTGKYDHLNPHKFTTDAGGIGSYQSQIGLSIGKLSQIRGIHYLNTRFAMSYSIPSSVSVSGFNAFGGELGTKGIVYPPQSFNANLGLEYSLSQNWALAFDVNYTYSPKTRFKGVNGDGIAVGTSALWSLAPAIEYSWNENWGMIAGYWVTVAGRNARAFQSGVIAVNYFYMP